MKVRQQIPIMGNSANVPSGIPVPFELCVEMETDRACNIRIETSPLSAYVDVLFTTAPELWSMKFTTPQDALTVRDGTGAFKSVSVEYEIPDAHFIMPSEISTLAREVYIDDSKAERFIEEAEELDVRPALGDKMTDYAKRNMLTLPELMNGTTYTYNGATYTFAGLKKAVAYYAYARLIVGGDIEVTRSGLRSRDSEYSHQATMEERQQVSRECSAIADLHMNQLLEYIKRTDSLAANLERPKRADTQRTKCKIIGD